jgi:uncharacterized membrane protein
MIPKTPSHNEVEDFLRRFRRGLAALPADIRDDFVAEVRAHIEERTAQGAFDLKSSFGSPEEYASRIIGEGTLNTAVDRGNPLFILTVLLGTARTTALTAFVVLPLAVLEIMACALTLIGLLKPVSSSHVGLFLFPNGSFAALGWVSDPRPMHEVLGYAAMPLFIFCGLLLLWVAHALMLRVARGELLRMRAIRPI